MIALFIGSAMVVGNMAIQIAGMMWVISLLKSRMDRFPQHGGFYFQMRVMGTIVLVLFLGHVLQFAIWAALFMKLGEFTEFSTAFYYSSVTFTSLGYGDIVMTEKWRLLGGLEAANGVLMFGLSASAILSVMTWLFNRENKDDPRF